MSNNTEEQITRNVLNSMAQAPNARLKEVMSSLITHLHAFIREVNLTEAEWMQGIQFLTRTGQMCDDRRQEFILLSDVIGVSMLVDAINHRAEDGATESTVFGPFYREGTRELPPGATISLDGRGEPAVVMGRVLSTDGTPIPGALLDVWETDENGLYEQQDPEQPDMNLRGKFRTDSQGRYCFVVSNQSPIPYPTMGRSGNCCAHWGVTPIARLTSTCSFQPKALCRSPPISSSRATLISIRTLSLAQKIRWSSILSGMIRTKRLLSTMSTRLFTRWSTISC